MQEILDKWGIKIDYNTILSMWNESHRFYHNQDHLLYLIDKIGELKESLGSQKNYEKMILCALFHDCIYDPKSSANEEDSANFFESKCININSDILDIKQMIIDTKNHVSDSELSQKFINLDMSVLEGNYDELIKWESGIKNEYLPVYGNENYKKGRLSFLESIIDKYPNNMENLSKLIELVKGI